MLRARSRFDADRPTYEIVPRIGHGSSRSSVVFHAHEVGLVNSGDCIAITSGKLRVDAPPGASTVAVDHRLHLRQRRIEAVGRGGVDLHAVQESADAGAERRALVDGIRQSRAAAGSRPSASRRIRSARRDTAAAGSPAAGTSASASALGPSPGSTMPLKRSPPVDEAAGAIDRRRGRGGVEPTVERRHRLVGRAPRLPQRIAQAELERQIARRLPAVLGVQVVGHRRAIGVFGLLPNSV